MRIFRIKILSIIIVMLSLLIFVGCSSVKTSGSDLDVQTNGMENEEGKLIIHFIDVGQADAILIQLPNGETSLIDGGNRADADLLIKYLKEYRINKINYLIATHPHEDHIGGLPEIVRNFNIGKIYMPNKGSNTKIYESLLTEIKSKNLKVNAAKGGQNIINTEDLKFTILAPSSEEYDEINEYSIVNKLIFKDTSFLFTGDAEKDSEDEMIKHGYNLSADLLKVGHHGGRTSTNEDFLRMVNPKYAIISVDKDNDYSHPHIEVLERLKLQNIHVLRTDELGSIIVFSDGDKIHIDKDIDYLKNNVPHKSNNDNKQNSYFLGNKNTKVYHSTTCGSLPKKENQIKLKSKLEAENQGYRPHKTCIK